MLQFPSILPLKLHLLISNDNLHNNMIYINLYTHGIMWRAKKSHGMSLRPCVTKTGIVLHNLFVTNQDRFTINRLSLYQFIAKALLVGSNSDNHLR